MEDKGIIFVKDESKKPKKKKKGDIDRYSGLAIALQIFFIVYLFLVIFLPVDFSGVLKCSKN